MTRMLLAAVEAATDWAWADGDAMENKTNEVSAHHFFMLISLV